MSPFMFTAVEGSSTSQSYFFYPLILYQSSIFVVCEQLYFGQCKINNVRLTVCLVSKNCLLSNYLLTPNGGCVVWCVSVCHHRWVNKRYSSSLKEQQAKWQLFWLRIFSLVYSSKQIHMNWTAQLLCMGIRLNQFNQEMKEKDGY